MGEENQTQGKEGLTERGYARFWENITLYAANPSPVAGPQAATVYQIKPTSGTNIPQRLYCQGTSIPDGEAPQIISFAMAHGSYFPAEFALAGQYTLLIDGDSAVFAENNQTINLRIEWPGYDGWSVQIRTVNYQEKRKGITRAKLVTEIAKQLVKFIEAKQSTTIDPAHGIYRVGPGGIELRHLRIVSLERVSRGSWQPCLIYSDP